MLAPVELARARLVLTLGHASEMLPVGLNASSAGGRALRRQGRLVTWVPLDLPSVTTRVSCLCVDVELCRARLGPYGDLAAHQRPDDRDPDGRADGQCDSE